MPDHLSTAADHLPSTIEAEQAAVRSQCDGERADLIAEMGTLAPEAEELTGFQAWAENSFPTLEPHDKVAAAVQMFQAEEREFDPEYDVTTEAPQEIAGDIQLYLNQMTSQARNANTGAEIENGVPAKVPAEVGAESRLLIEERDLEDAQIGLEAQRSSLVSDREDEQITDGAEKAKTAELRQLQLTFNQLRADGMGTSDAFRHVIAQAENPETKTHLNTLLGRVALLQTALPGKPDVVNRLLNMPSRAGHFGFHHNLGTSPLAMHKTMTEAPHSTGSILPKSGFFPTQLGEPKVVLRVVSIVVSKVVTLLVLDNTKFRFSTGIERHKFIATRTARSAIQDS